MKPTSYHTTHQSSITSDSQDKIDALIEQNRKIVLHNQQLTSYNQELIDKINKLLCMFLDDGK